MYTTKKETKTESITHEVVVEEKYICNKCGKQIRPFEDGIYSDINSINLSFGYGSPHDMEGWAFDLCDSCLDEIIKQLKFVPDGFYIDNTEPKYSHEIHQKAFEDWKKTGEYDAIKYLPYEQLKELGWIYDFDYLNGIIKEKYPDKPLLNASNFDEDFQEIDE